MRPPNLAVLTVVGAASIALVSASPSAPAPAACDAQLSEGQRTIKELCETFAGCRLVMSLFDACSDAERWLDAVGPAPGTKQITGWDVSRGVAAMGSSDGVEITDGPRAEHCLPSSFDQARCRQFLGIDPVPIRVPPEPPRRSPDSTLRVRALVVYAEAADAERVPGPHHSARNMLETCARALRQRTDRDQICAEAQKRVDECNAFRDDWTARKTAILAEIERQQPALGQEYTQGKSIARDNDERTDPERWNDIVRSLRSREMAPCPRHLPDTFLTPAEALRELTQNETSPELLEREPTGLAETFEEALEPFPGRRRADQVAERRAREADEAKAREEQVAKEAAAEQERLLAEARAQEEKERRARERAAFEDRLAAANPGALYALGDELDAAGDTAQSGEAFRTLLERFPDHALAAVAAQRLAGRPDSATAAKLESAAPAPNRRPPIAAR